MTWREQVKHWRDEANCVSTDPEAFFPEKGHSTKPALSVCARCPVQEPCLEFAIEHQMNEGVWGGKSAAQLREIRRERGMTITLAGPVERTCDGCGEVYEARRATSRYCGSVCRIQAIRPAAAS